MIGLFLDPRAWEIDFLASNFWQPERWGVKIDLHPNAFNIPKTGVDKKYRFVLATEIWESKMRVTLEYLRRKGLKVFLVAREPIKYGDLVDAMFKWERYNINGEYYFKPDVVLAAGEAYGKLWEGKTRVVVTGYPRWDWYIQNKVDSALVREKYKLHKTKKIIFFPSFPPYHYQKGKEMLDLFDFREAILQTAENFVNSNQDYQFVAKIHPMSMKCYKKGTGKGNEVAGRLKKYFLNPTDNFRVIGDVRLSGDVAKELLCSADLVVGYSSTMLLEAAMLEKPVINAVMGNGGKIKGPHDSAFETATNEKELLGMLNDFKFDRKNFISTKAKKRAEYFMHELDGKSCERICKAIKAEL